MDVNLINQPNFVSNINLSYNQLNTYNNFTWPFHRHIFEKSVTWDNVVFYMNFNKHRFRQDVQHYWLDIFLDYISTPFIINYILIAEDDAPPFEEILKYFTNYTSFLNVSVVRVPTTPNSEYKRLVCKMTAGMKRVYELFPDKKFYVKIDDDTVLYPIRLMKLLRTTNLFYRVDDVPIYIGKCMKLFIMLYIYLRSF